LSKCQNEKFRSDEDSAATSNLHIEIADLKSQLEDIRDDVESERKLREKAETQKQQIHDELETLRTEFIDADNKTVISQQLQQKKDDEIKQLRVRSCILVDYIYTNIFSEIWKL